MAKRVAPPLPDWPDPEAAIIAEVADESLALELWRAIRKARLFAITPPEARACLFKSTNTLKIKRLQQVPTDIPRALEPPLRTFAQLASGRKVSADALSGACARIADWAAERSLAHTAAHFARAAVGVAPEDPTMINLSALMYRRSGDWKRARQLYARAISLARTQGNKIEYICGHIGCAALLYSRGVAVTSAVDHLRTASRVARKDTGSLWLASHALHDSMLLQVQREQFPAAEETAREAAELYPLHDSRFPHFVVDFAFVQLEQNKYAMAVPLLQLCLRTIEQPAVRAVVMSLLARAFAGLGDAAEFARYRQSARRLAGKFAEHAATVEYHLGEAARACRLWPEAEQHARKARHLAMARGDRELIRLAARTFRFARDRQIASQHPTTGESLADQLARELEVRLRGWDRRRSLQGASRRKHFRNQWLA